MYIIDTAKLIEIFYDCDEFCKKFNCEFNKLLLTSKSIKSVNKPSLCESEIMAILIFYQLSGMKCFQYYYEDIILKRLKEYFPKAVSYNRFIELIPRIFIHIMMFINSNRIGKQTGIYYVDSKKLPVCHNLRIHSHKVFKGIAQRGKTSTGWFYGLKLFLVINQNGQIIKFLFTPANIADNNENILCKLFDKLKGKAFGDRGFITKQAFEKLYNQGLKLVTGIRRNMKNKLMEIQEKFFLAKRGIIECVYDLLMTICDIDHTRHRSPVNAFVHMMGGLAAYTYYDKLPSIFKRYLLTR